MSLEINISFEIRCVRGKYQITFCLQNARNFASEQCKLNLGIMWRNRCKKNILILFVCLYSQCFSDSVDISLTPKTTKQPGRHFFPSDN